MNSVELPNSAYQGTVGQYRAKPQIAACRIVEGVTTRAKARRAKRPEAPSPTKVGEDIVSSAWEHAAARKGDQSVAYSGEDIGHSKCRYAI